MRPATRRLLRPAGTAVVLTALVTTGLAATSSTRSKAPRAPDGAAARVIAAARHHLGERYVWGATGPSSWDCSGLTSTLWRTVGHVRSIPRTSREQQAWSIPTPADQALPGDLVFFESPVTHVGIYLGRGRMLDASSSRGGVVERRIWKTGVIRYGRVPRATAPPVRGQPDRRQRPRRPRLPPIGVHPRTRASAYNLGVAKAARSRAGRPWSPRSRGPRAYGVAGLVDWSSRHAHGPRLPVTSAALERLTRPVAFDRLTYGDLIFYGRPATHVAVYLGAGYMVDASPTLRRVVIRRVIWQPTLRYRRLVPPGH